jgi:hypothetical protein
MRRDASLALNRDKRPANGPRAMLSSRETLLAGQYCIPCLADVNADPDPRVFDGEVAFLSLVMFRASAR